MKDDTVWKQNIKGYVPKGQGFIDEGWEEQSLFFRNYPSQEDVKQFVRCTEISKWSIAGRPAQVKLKSDFTYINENKETSTRELSLEERINKVLGR